MHRSMIDSWVGDWMDGERWGMGRWMTGEEGRKVVFPDEFPLIRE